MSVCAPTTVGPSGRPQVRACRAWYAHITLSVLAPAWLAAGVLRRAAYTLYGLHGGPAEGADG
ncbi:hypothetical protein ABZV91_28130 [Nocardia sp. NPDC004568]|uniref:hypothetical protein n=1 Tax=Nocardia sp. NPDC004568 TaxID=3154551 RepID=UPI0033A88465